MVTPGSRQAKGYAIQISLLLENVPNLELGESSEFPSSKVLTKKTVHRYIVLNDKVGMEVVTAEPRVKKTPVRKAKKRPATDADAERVVKKKRTTKSKSVSTKETLETLPVEAVPLQMIAPIPVVPTEQPPVPKRKTQKRKRRLILGSDDDIVEVEPVIESVGISEAETAVVSVDVESVVVEPVSLPAVVVVLNEGISTTDEVDIIIEQAIAETAQIDTDVGDQDVVTSEVGDKAAGTADEFELWFNLSSEEIQARLDADRPIETASDTDEEFIADQVFGTGVEKMETEDVEQSADEVMSLEDILLTIPVECPLPSAGVEVTKIILGGTISIPGVNEGDWYKDSLPKISMLREKIIDEVDRFFNSFSLKRDIEMKSTERFYELDRVNRASRLDSQDIRTVLSLDIRSSQKQLSAQIAAAAIDNVDVRRELGDIVDFLRGGDAKKGEGSSSRPQPPHDDHSRPSGGTGGSGSGAQGQSRPGLGSVNRGSASGISQSKGNRSGSSKRRSSGGESPVRRKIWSISTYWRTQKEC
ncbi:hypothetical protein F511_09853 [Dorcoceras hygrometricum]|uniref:Uncharacterized protein n=1 Tax=Dorcoceras hygrometricum TaxID=472368 RepID=A0A2Z7CCN1_9LAMI|nr:hypothetical protein F511_09853 [Dorcoceras hygrometricum]